MVIKDGYAKTNRLWRVYIAIIFLLFLCCKSCMVMPFSLKVWHRIPQKRHLICMHMHLYAGFSDFRLTESLHQNIYFWVSWFSILFVFVEVESNLSTESSLWLYAWCYSLYYSHSFRSITNYYCGKTCMQNLFLYLFNAKSIMSKDGHFCEI